MSRNPVGDASQNVRKYLGSLFGIAPTDPDDLFIQLTRGNQRTRIEGGGTSERYLRLAAENDALVRRATNLQQAAAVAGITNEDGAPASNFSLERAPPPMFTTLIGAASPTGRPFRSPINTLADAALELTDQILALKQDVDRVSAEGMMSLLEEQERENTAVPEPASQQGETRTQRMIREQNERLNRIARWIPGAKQGRNILLEGASAPASANANAAPLGANAATPANAATVPPSLRSRVTTNPFSFAPPAPITPGSAVFAVPVSPFSTQFSGTMAAPASSTSTTTTTTPATPTLSIEATPNALPTQFARTPRGRMTTPSANTRKFALARTTPRRETAPQPSFLPEGSPFYPGAPSQSPSVSFVERLAQQQKQQQSQATGASAVNPAVATPIPSLRYAPSTASQFTTPTPRPTGTSSILGESRLQPDTGFEDYGAASKSGAGAGTKRQRLAPASTAGDTIRANSSIQNATVGVGRFGTPVSVDAQENIGGNQGISIQLHFADGSQVVRTVSVSDATNPNIAGTIQRVTISTQTPNGIEEQAFVVRGRVSDADVQAGIEDIVAATSGIVPSPLPVTRRASEFGESDDILFPPEPGREWIEHWLSADAWRTYQIEAPGKRPWAFDVFAPALVAVSIEHRRSLPEGSVPPNDRTSAALLAPPPSLVALSRGWWVQGGIGLATAPGSNAWQAEAADQIALAAAQSAFESMGIGMQGGAFARPVPVFAWAAILRHPLPQEIAPNPLLDGDAAPLPAGDVAWANGPFASLDSAEASANQARLAPDYAYSQAARALALALGAPDGCVSSDARLDAELLVLGWPALDTPTQSPQGSRRVAVLAVVMPWSPAATIDVIGQERTRAIAEAAIRDPRNVIRLDLASEASQVQAAVDPRLAPELQEEQRLAVVANVQTARIGAVARTALPSFRIAAQNAMTRALSRVLGVPTTSDEPVCEYTRICGRSTLSPQEQPNQDSQFWVGGITILMFALPTNVIDARTAGRVRAEFLPLVATTWAVALDS